MREPERSLLMRELAIAATAARKLSVALSLAWAYLREGGERDSVCSNEKGVSPHVDQKKDRRLQAVPSLPGLEEPFE